MNAKSQITWLLQLGGFFIWTYTYQLIRTSSIRWKVLQAAEEAQEATKWPNTDLDANGDTHLLKGEDEEQGVIVASETSVNQAVSTLIYLKLQQSGYICRIYAYIYSAWLFGRSGLLNDR